MADWPATLPNPQYGGASFEPWNNTIRTQMDAGTPKMRRRYTAVGANVVYMILVTEAEAQTLDGFVAGTLKDVLTFNWKDFRKAGHPAAVYRFRSRPKYESVSFGLWRATLELEILP